MSPGDGPAQLPAEIIRQLRAGATEREVAWAVGKSAAHVHFVSVAWGLMVSAGVDFPAAYRMAKDLRIGRAKVTGVPSVQQFSGPTAFPKRLPRAA